MAKIEFNIKGREDQILLFLKKFLPEDIVILEAGANRGEDTRKMHSVWPKAIIHAFEPLPSSFKELVSNTCDLKNVITYQYALADTIGTSSFYIDHENNAASSLGYPNKWLKHEVIEVPCTSIDDWAKKNNVSQVDFMWLDMEGFELHALRYASLLKFVKAIYLEVCYVPINKNTGLYRDLKEFLETENFVEVWRWSDNSGVFGDALFLKKDYHWPTDIIGE